MEKTVLLSNFSDFYNKIEKYYVKWWPFAFAAVYGLKFCAHKFAEPNSANQPESDVEVADLANPSIPKLFGYAKLPNLEDQAAIDAYIAKHQTLSSRFLEENNHPAAMYHATLLLLVHPDPMAYFETNSGTVRIKPYRTARNSLTNVLKAIDHEIPQR